VKEQLEQAILMPMMWRHPQFALEHLAGRLPGTSMLSYTLTIALKNVAEKDPAKAMRWLDDQIASGRLTGRGLDGISHERLSFEGTLAARLLSSDPDALSRRVEALPAGQRAAFFENLGNEWALDAAAQDAYVALVRNHLPPGKQSKALARQAESLAQDLSKVRAFLDRGAFSPSERTEAVAAAGERNIVNVSCNRLVTSADIDAMRRWVAGEDPGAVGQVTGRALAVATDRGIKMGFNEAAAFALAYSQEDGGDDLLSTFLNSASALKNRSQARELAIGIRDEASRTRILKRLE
jgi:hypothetical protein